MIVQQDYKANSLTEEIIIQLCPWIVSSAYFSEN